MTTNKLPEWRKALNTAVENYQSTRSWYEENRDSPAALDDMERAEDHLTKFVRECGFRIVLDLLDELQELRQLRIADGKLYRAALGLAEAERAELQERRKADSEKIAITITTEQRRVIEMLLAVCSAAFELADDSCQQDVDGEECHVVPDDSFKTLVRTLDEIENTLPTEDADRPDVFLAWAAMPRAVLKFLLHAAPPAPVVPEEKRDDDGSVTSDFDHGWNACRAAMLHAGNSPVTPDGWQLVPKEPTEAMNKAGWAAINEHDEINPTYRAMLEAAPRHEVK